MQKTKAKVIRVALADKNPLIQAALKQLLSEDERFELVHVTASCQAFLNITATRKKASNHSNA